MKTIIIIINANFKSHKNSKGQTIRIIYIIIMDIKPWLIFLHLILLDNFLCNKECIFFSSLEKKNLSFYQKVIISNHI